VGGGSQDAHRNRLDFDLSPPHRVSSIDSYDVLDEGAVHGGALECAA
jgi:hypothetical protein